MFRGISLIRGDIKTDDYCLESHSEHEADAVFLCCRQIEIVESANILHMHNLEDIMNTKCHLNVWFTAVHKV